MSERERDTRLIKLAKEIVAQSSFLTEFERDFDVRAYEAFGREISRLEVELATLTRQLAEAKARIGVLENEVADLNDCFVRLIAAVDTYVVDSAKLASTKIDLLSNLHGEQEKARAALAPPAGEKGDAARAKAGNVPTQPNGTGADKWEHAKRVISAARAWNRAIGSDFLDAGGVLSEAIEEYDAQGFDCAKAGKGE